MQNNSLPSGKPGKEERYVFSLKSILKEPVCCAIFLVYFYPRVKRNKDSLNSKNMWCQTSVVAAETSQAMLASQKTWVQYHVLVFALWCQFPLGEEAVGPKQRGPPLFRLYQAWGGNWQHRCSFDFSVILEHLFFLSGLNCTSTLRWIHVPDLQKQTLSQGNCWHLARSHRVPLEENTPALPMHSSVLFTQMLLFPFSIFFFFFLQVSAHTQDSK